MATCSPQALPRESTCFHCIPPLEKHVLKLYLLNLQAGTFTARQLSVGATPFRPISGHLALAAKVYLLTVINGLSLSPSALEASAACYQCIPNSARLDVETYLLAVNAGGSLNPATLTGQIGPYKSLFPIRDQVELYLLNILAGTLSIAAIMAGAKCLTCLSTGRLEEIYIKLLCMGTGGTGCVDVAASLVPVITGIYDPDLHTLIALNIVFPKVCCSPSGYRIIAQNGLTLQTGTISAAHAGETNYTLLNVDVTGILLPYTSLTVKQVCSGGTLSGGSNSVDFDEPLDPVVVDWAARVVINGGAAPSVNSKYASNTFIGALRTAGIFSKMKTINMVAPDNLIAAETPLIVGPGLDPWPDVGASNFVAADLSLYGLACDGTKALNTGVGGTQLSLASAGLTIVASILDPNPTLTLRYDMGYLNAAAQEYMFVAADQNSGGVVGHAGGSSFSSGLITNTGAADSFAGYVSYNRTSVVRADLYWANNDVAHSSIGNNTNNQTLGLSAAPIYFGAVRDSAGGAIPYYSKNTLSFAAVHDGLTAAESLAFFNAVNALRTSFGGGWGDIGDSYVGSWSNRIVAAGGVTPGAASKSAVHTLATDLWSAGIIRKILHAIPLVSDSLIAAITPIFYNGVGNASWANTNFILADLTANGLLGAATKFLNTGFIPNASGAGLTDGSAGLIVYTHTNNAVGVQHEIGVYWAAFQSFFGLLTDYNAGNTEGAAWMYSGNDNISTVTPASLTGYYAFQRTTTSRADIYFARSNVAHSSIANSVGLIGGTAADKALFAFGANNNGGGVTGESLKRLSFIAITTGLSSAESALAYTAIQAFRTALGGGAV